MPPVVTNGILRMPVARFMRLRTRLTQLRTVLGRHLLLTNTGTCISLLALGDVLQQTLGHHVIAKAKAWQMSSDEVDAKEEDDDDDEDEEEEEQNAFDIHRMSE